MREKSRKIAVEVFESPDEEHLSEKSCIVRIKMAGRVATEDLSRLEALFRTRCVKRVDLELGHSRQLDERLFNIVLASNVKVYGSPFSFGQLRGVKHVEFLVGPNFQVTDPFLDAIREIPFLQFHFDDSKSNLAFLSDINCEGICLVFDTMHGDVVLPPLSHRCRYLELNRLHGKGRFILPDMRLGLEFLAINGELTRHLPEFLNTVRCLNLGEISKFDARDLVTIHNLEELELNSIDSEFSLSPLASNSSLSRVDLIRCKYGHRAVEEEFSSTLKTLYIIPFDCIQDIPPIPSLERLAIIGDLITVNRVSGLKNLRELCVNDLRDRSGFQRLIAHAPKLKEVKIREENPLNTLDFKNVTVTHGVGYDNFTPGWPEFPYPFK